MSTKEGIPFPDMFEIGEEGCLFQGDIIKISKGECDFFDGQDDALGCLIVSNSCDLDHPDDDMDWISVVLIYPYELTLRESLEDKTEKISNKLIKEQAKGNTLDVESELETTIADIIHKDANYKPKFTFFISPLEGFNPLPSIVYLNDIRSIDITSKTILLKNGVCSMKGSCREQLGYKVGNLFNRVSTLHSHQM